MIYVCNPGPSGYCSAGGCPECLPGFSPDPTGPEGAAGSWLEPVHAEASAELGAGEPPAARSTEAPG